VPKPNRFFAGFVRGAFRRTFRTRRGASSSTCIAPERSMTYGCRRETGSKPSKGIARASTAFASMTDGESAFSGARAMPSRLKSWTITNDMRKAKDRLAPVHPGDVLREDFMKPLGFVCVCRGKGHWRNPHCHQ